MEKWVEATFYSLLAGLGGALGDAMRRLNSNQPILWGRTITQGAAAAFVGFLVYQLCIAFGLSREWTSCVVGVCGWLGASATIQMLEPIVQRVIGAKKND